MIDHRTTGSNTGRRFPSSFEGPTFSEGHALRCKARKVSVQGAVTAATMVAQAIAQAAKNPLPQTIIMQCPVDVRKQACPCRICQLSACDAS